MKKGKKISIVAIIILVLLGGRACGGRNTSETKVEDQAKPETETSVAVEDNEPAEEESEAPAETAASDTDDTGVLSPEFKKTMDDYEAWFDHYCEVLKKYQENPSDAALLSEMTELLTEEEKMLEQLDNLDDSELNAAEQAYYIDVTARIHKKILEISN